MTKRSKLVLIALVLSTVSLFTVSCAPPRSLAPSFGEAAHESPSQRVQFAALTNEAATFFGAGNFAQAEQSYRLALKIMPTDTSDSITLRIGLAATLARQFAVATFKDKENPQYKEAAEIFKKLLAQRPNALGIVLSCASGFADLGEAAQSLKLFEHGFNLAQAPDFKDNSLAAIAMRNYATVAYKNGLFAEAVRASQKAYETEPSALEASRHLAILNPLGLTREAANFAGLVLGIYTTDGEVITRSAAAFAAAGDCQQAEVVAIRVLEKGLLAEKIRRDARVIIDWCHGNNRLAELQAEELATFPVSMRAEVNGHQD